MNAKEISERLVSLCREGKNLEAINTLMSSKVVSVEAMGDPSMPAVMSGIKAVRGKNQWWIQNHTVHSSTIKGPFPNGDRFAVIFDFVVTPLAGPGAGKKMRMEEVALYTVARGKIVREEFFYDMGGAGDPSAKKAAAKKPVKKAAKKQVKKVASAKRKAR